MHTSVAEVIIFPIMAIMYDVYSVYTPVKK